MHPPPSLPSQLRLTIEDGSFRDAHGRTVVLRGINVAGDAKCPSEPDMPSHVADNFFDGDSVSFHRRPFPKEDAAMHFARLRRYGYNTIRYIFTWESVEAAGPGRYDDDFITHMIEVLRVAKAYGFYIFLDPHQDVWSRFTGGSGAPMWTLYAAGLNPQSFLATEAALVQNTYPKPEEMPKMIWATNYFRLAAATMFTLFWAGREFAPRCVINGVNIQDYLQTHYIAACSRVARRIHEAGDLEDSVVVGWESLNEPHPGWCGHPDLARFHEGQPLKKGTAPTAWQCLLTGMGRACEVETWDVGGMGPYPVGRKLVDPHGERAWLPEDYDDSRYGWKRDPDWKLGHCIWAMHGVWDPDTDTLLRKDYFLKKPGTDSVIDHAFFADTYFMHHYRHWRDALRAVHARSILVLQSPTLELPPRIRDTPDDDPRMVFAPHWYDGITLMTKHFNRVWNVDVVGLLRGRYWTPAFAVKIGESAIRNCFRDQMRAMRREALDRMGRHPVVMTEFGIPYDMDQKAAYASGDYTAQCAAMDANYYAIEGSGLEGHCLWVYCPTNDHRRGDQWNGEDLSIVSVDDPHLPASTLPRTPGTYDEGTMVDPGNLHRTLTGETMSSAAAAAAEDDDDDDDDDHAKPDASTTVDVAAGPSAAQGFRAAEAFVRPSPVAVVGAIKSYGFDLRNCVFNLVVDASPPGKDGRSDDGRNEDGSNRNEDGNDDDDAVPTTVYLPDFHFPRDRCDVQVSSGRWEISIDDSEEGVLVQTLRWWHLGGEQTLRVAGVARKMNEPAPDSRDAGYLEQCWRVGANIGGSCSVM